MPKAKKIKNEKINVGVVFGGRSGEHEVSIVSAESVIKALDHEQYNVIPIGITKEGHWIAGDKAVAYLKSTIKSLPFKSLLLPDPTEQRLINVSAKKFALAKAKNSFTDLDVIIPVLHGTTGEDGCLQGLLEMANLPYVGAGVLGSALGMDKVVQKQLFEQASLPVVNYVWFLNTDWQKNKVKIVEVLENKLHYPMFTKPANSGSSVGISKCHNQGELVSGIALACKYDRKVLVEQGIEDFLEIEVAVLGNDEPQASVCGEIKSSNEFYDYNAKYVDGKSQAIIPAKISDELSDRIRSLALMAYKTLDLAGLSRVDFLVRKKDQKVYINEVNTLPGFTSISMYPKLWEATGLSYGELLDRLIKLAIKRHEAKAKLITFYNPKKKWYK